MNTKKLTAWLSAAAMLATMITPAAVTNAEDSDISAAVARTITVGKDAEDDFSSIRDAVNSIKTSPASEAERITINVDPGDYEEQVRLDNLKYITLQQTPGTEGRVDLHWYFCTGYCTSNTDLTGLYNPDIDWSLDQTWNGYNEGDEEFKKYEIGQSLEGVSTISYYDKKGVQHKNEPVNSSLKNLGGLGWSYDKMAPLIVTKSSSDITVKDFNIVNSVPVMATQGERDGHLTPEAGRVLDVDKDAYALLPRDMLALCTEYTEEKKPTADIFTSTGAVDKRKLMAAVNNGTTFTAEESAWLAKSSAFNERGHAIAILGDRITVENVRVRGNQDSIWASDGRIYFKNCDLIGGTDYIYGSASAVFDNCKLGFEGFSDYSYGSPLATPNTPADKKYGYLFWNCTIYNVRDNNGVNNFGGPWGASGQATYCNTTLDNGDTLLYGKSKAAIEDKGWGRFGAENGLARIYEYGTKNADGTLVDTSKRVVNKSVEEGGTGMGTVLDKWQILEFNPRNVFGTNNGWKDNWDPMNFAQSIADTDAAIAASNVNVPAGEETTVALPVPEDSNIEFKWESSSTNAVVSEDGKQLTVVRPAAGEADISTQITLYARNKTTGCGDKRDIPVTIAATTDTTNVFTMPVTIKQSAAASNKYTVTVSKEGALIKQQVIAVTDTETAAAIENLPASADGIDYDVRVVSESGDFTITVPEGGMTTVKGITGKDVPLSVTALKQEDKTVDLGISYSSSDGNKSYDLIALAKSKGAGNDISTSDTITVTYTLDVTPTTSGNSFIDILAAEPASSLSQSGVNSRYILGKLGHWNQLDMVDSAQGYSGASNGPDQWLNACGKFTAGVPSTVSVTIDYKNKTLSAKGSGSNNETSYTFETFPQSYEQGKLYMGIYAGSETFGVRDVKVTYKHISTGEEPDVPPVVEPTAPPTEAPTAQPTAAPSVTPDPNAIKPSEFTALTDGYTFIAEENNSDGQSIAAYTWIKGNEVYAAGNAGIKYANNKGSSEINGVSHVNTMRLKGAQDCIAFVLARPSEVTVYGQSHSSRVFGAGVVVGGVDLAKGTLGSNTFTFNAPAGVVIYITGVNDADNSGGDLYFGGFTVKAAGTDPNPTTQPTTEPTTAPTTPPTPVPDTAKAIVSAVAKDGKTDVMLKNITEGVIVGVTYDDNGVMTAIKTAPAVSGVSVMLDGIEADKVFVWDSIEGMKPICPSVYTTADYPPAGAVEIDFTAMTAAEAYTEAAGRGFVEKSGAIMPETYRRQVAPISNISISSEGAKVTESDGAYLSAPHKDTAVGMDGNTYNNGGLIYRIDTGKPGAYHLEVEVTGTAADTWVAPTGMDASRLTSGNSWDTGGHVPRTVSAKWEGSTWSYDFATGESFIEIEVEPVKLATASAPQTVGIKKITVTPLEVNVPGDKPTIHVLGDSTQKTYTYNETISAWGQTLVNYFDPEKVNVVNYSMGGRAMKSNYNEGRFGEILINGKAGDYVFIHSAHNDETVSNDRFGRGSAVDNAQTTDALANNNRNYLRWMDMYISAIKARGMTPVLVTAMPRTGNGRYSESAMKPNGFNPDSPGNMRKAAAADPEVGLVDLYAGAKAYIDKLDANEVKYFYNNYEAGESPANSAANGTNGDGTHYREAASKMWNRIMLQSIYDQSVSAADTYNDKAVMEELTALMPDNVVNAAKTGDWSAVFPEMASDVSAVDVVPGASKQAESNYYYRNNIEKALQVGLVHKDTNNMFKPNDIITVGEFAKGMEKAFFLPEGTLANYEKTYAELQAEAQPAAAEVYDTEVNVSAAEGETAGEGDITVTVEQPTGGTVTVYNESAFKTAVTDITAGVTANQVLADNEYYTFTAPSDIAERSDDNGAMASGITKDAFEVRDNGTKQAKYTAKADGIFTAYLMFVDHKLITLENKTTGAKSTKYINNTTVAGTTRANQYAGVTFEVEAGNDYELYTNGGTGRLFGIKYESTNYPQSTSQLMVNSGDKIRIVAVPNDYYINKSILVNGEKAAEGKETIVQVTENITVSAEFEAEPQLVATTRVASDAALTREVMGAILYDAYKAADTATAEYKNMQIYMNQNGSVPKPGDPDYDPNVKYEASVYIPLTGWGLLEDVNMLNPTLYQKVKEAYNLGLMRSEKDIARGSINNGTELEPTAQVTRAKAAKTLLFCWSLTRTPSDGNHTINGGNGISEAALNQAAVNAADIAAPNPDAKADVFTN